MSLHTSTIFSNSSFPFTVHLSFLSVRLSVSLSVCPALIRLCGPPPRLPSHRHHQLFSAICCHCDQSPFHRTSHLTEVACSKAVPYLAQMNSSTNLWSPPLPPRASISQSPPSSLHLPPSRCTSVSDWSHISSAACKNEASPLLSTIFLSSFSLSPHLSRPSVRF